MANKVEIISHAFTNLGQKPISDLQVGNPLKAAVLSIYDTLYPALLSIRPWSFALFTQELVKLTEAPLIKNFQSAFQLPTDPKFLKAWLTQPNCDFIIHGDQIYTNLNKMTLTYVGQVLEESLPDPFVIFFEDSLSSRVAMTLTQQPSLMRLWQVNSQASFSIASLTDSQNAPNLSILDQSVFNSHFGPNGYGINSGRWS